MAQAQSGGVVSVGHVVPGRAGNATGLSEAALAHTLISVPDMDRVLENGLSWSAARISQATVNDKQLAIRTAVTNAVITVSDLLPPATIDATADPVDEVLPFGTVWINEATPEAFQTPGDGTWVSIWNGAP